VGRQIRTGGRGEEEWGRGGWAGKYERSTYDDVT